MKKIAIALVPLTVVTALIAVGWWIIAATRPGSTTSSKKEPLDVVLLGDSYASGNGAGEYTDTDCWRSPFNYGALVATALNARFTDASCSSAVLDSITSAPQKLGNFTHETRTFTITEANDPWKEWQERARSEGVCATKSANLDISMSLSAQSNHGNDYTATAWCSATNKTQVSAVTKTTDVVLVSIGGNDAGFAAIAAGCLTARSARACNVALSHAENYVSGEFRSELTRTLTGISEASGSNTQVFLVGYPTLLGNDHFTLGGTIAPKVDVSKRLTALQNAADQAGEAAAASAGANVHFVSTRSALAKHSFDPEAPEDSWIIGPFGTWNVREYFHPTREGWAAIASVVEKQVRETLQLPAK
ncbi:lysophospholipase L1-like esterase [Arcanobacterium wilhelmae]|uniref:Lysophospholipase L1-like esterase n=1 Tax=Arcanobacterium wilhelmae TaxID=1803177 RepID=A0ABT9NA51_9ACTO|nr:SGNH/GDSL hydrolase family protein [Arcanobacterium wilhelmae]MDP9800388.1 lysophospholipase L1-like esterase [Arcanobacterium wilhelmae]WFN89819.1 SGNH/GDSL hydrolase family protein [Arcanobacterium wilhelmae]